MRTREGESLFNDCAGGGGGGGGESTLIGFRSLTEAESAAIRKDKSYCGRSDGNRRKSSGAQDDARD